MKSPPRVKNSSRNQPSKPNPNPSRSRGRPRSPEVRRAILRAAHELLKEGGVSAVTIEGIAARAGVGKPTIYRSWPNAQAVAMAALMESETVGATSPVRESETQRMPSARLNRQSGPTEPAGSASSSTGAQSSERASTLSPPAPSPEVSPLARLRDQLREIAQVFSTPLGRNVTLMIASAERETELSKAFRNHFILARRNEGRTLIEEAIIAGHLRADLDVEVALDLIYSPIFYRLLMGHAPLNAAFTDAMLAHALRGLAVRPLHLGVPPGQ